MQHSNHLVVAAAKSLTEKNNSVNQNLACYCVVVAVNRKHCNLNLWAL
jgi:hypothetical protein